MNGHETDDVRVGASNPNLRVPVGRPPPWGPTNGMCGQLLRGAKQIVVDVANPDHFQPLAASGQAENLDRRVGR